MSQLIAAAKAYAPHIPGPHLPEGWMVRLRQTLAFAGPAVVASIAYVDPGNFATNITAGSHYGYALLWVVVGANLIAMLFQALSARLGIVTGRTLGELLRSHLPGPAVFGMWAVSEIAAMATDLAEFLGGAIGLSLLCHLPLLGGMAITGVATFLFLGLEARGMRPIEWAIGGLAALIAVCFVAELWIAPVDWAAASIGAIAPQLPDAAALTIALGIVGATVMPHALYLHSGLARDRSMARTHAERAKHVRYSNREVVAALGLAGLINMAMVILAAAAFHAGLPGIAEIETAHRALTPLLGASAGGLFLMALLASGLSSSVVGTMAGQRIMQDFVGFRIPVTVRRAVTMLPAFVVIALGVDTTRALILSQVVLSFALPLPMIALVVFTGRRDVMGAFAIGRTMHALAAGGAALIVGLNLCLIAQTFGVTIPLIPA